MKKIYLATLVLPLAFAACTNESLETIETPSVQGDMIALSENFAIGVGYGGDASSRADYSVEVNDRGKLQPFFTWTNGDKIGLGWIQGNDGLIYTNYQFDAFAYGLYKNAEKEETLKASMTQCAPYLWQNVAFFSQDDAELGDASTTYVSTWTPSLTPADASFTLNNRNAYFRTSNLTIFKGKYLIYFPFDETITEAGNLIAKSKASFNNVGAVIQDDQDSQEEKQNKFETIFEGIADNMFALGTANIDGGTTAKDFGLSPVSGIIRLQISIDKDAEKAWNKINKVAVYSPEGIQLEMAINASDESLIADEVKETKSLSASFSSMNIEKAEGKYLEVLIPALPQTITDAHVGLFDEDGNSIMIPVDDIIVDRGYLTEVPVTLTDAEALQNEVFYVVDMETFAQAMVNAGTSNAKNVTIKLLRDIEYDDDYTYQQSRCVQVVNNMVIEGADIIVPADQSLEVQLINKTDDIDANLTFNNGLVIKNKGCCGSADGSVTLWGSDQERNAFVFNGEVENNGDMKIGLQNKKTVAVFNEVVKNNNGLTITAVTNVDFADVENVGVLDMIGTGGLGAYATADNIDNKGDINVGKFTQLTIEKTLVNDGEVMVDYEGEDGYDGTININEDAVATNNGKIFNKGVFNNKGVTIGEAGSEFVDYVGSQSISYNPITVKEGAEYIAEVNTSDTTEGDRLAYALNDNVPTTTVRFVEDGKEHTYQLGDYKSGYSKLATVKYIVNVDDDTEVIFKNDKTTLTFGTKLTVVSAKSVLFNGNTTTVNGDVTVNEGTIQNNSTNGAKVVVAGNLTLNAATLNAKALRTSTVATQATTPSWKVAKNVVLNAGAKMLVEKGAAVDFNGDMTIEQNAEAKFCYSSYSDIAKKITVNGKFNRELSSGNQTANPAMVWCGSYDTANGTIINGGPQKRN